MAVLVDSSSQTNNNNHIFIDDPINSDTSKTPKDLGRDGSMPDLFLNREGLDFFKSLFS